MKPGNGRKLNIQDAKDYVENFRSEVEQLDIQLNRPVKPLAIGQKFDLDLITGFMTAIKRHNESESLKIDAVRIYMAKSERGGDMHYDVVLVPVLENDKDLHKVFPKDGFIGELDTLLGQGLPCPNVCPGNAFFC